MTVTRRHGTAQAPSVIREESRGLETYSFPLDKDLSEVDFCDIGDLNLPGDDLGRALEMIEAVSSRFYGMGRKVASFGGEHLVTLPVVRAAVKTFRDLVVIHLDAHADLRDKYHGMKYNHATVMRCIAENCLATPYSLYQFCIRSGTREEFEWGTANTSFFPGELLKPLGKCLEKIGGSPVYISIDIDAVEPAEAPGTGTPEPCGTPGREIFEALYRMKGLNVVGFDIVEVSPPHDVNNITSVLAAKMARECLIMWGGDIC
jgi:agmatinase